MNIPNHVINNSATGIQYASYIWHDGFVSVFCMSNPHENDFLNTSDPKFSFLMDNGQYRTEEHLNLKALQNGSALVNWTIKAHGKINKISFSTGSPGDTDHDGEFPIFPDGHGKYWRLLNTRVGGGGLCAFDLEEYFIPT